MVFSYVLVFFVVFLYQTENKKIKVKNVHIMDLLKKYFFVRCDVNPVSQVRMS